jgi:MYXO-CTERM domain-containing protein
MMAGQLGVAQWKFSQPVSDFGAWFENNSGADDATVSFYDAQHVLVGQVTAAIPFGETWKWNGWHSDTPFVRMVVSGNGVDNGFLWYENVQVNAAVPGPGSLAMLGLAMLPNRRRRRPAS